MDRRPAICGVLLLLACGGDDPTDPTETVDPGPPRFEAVGEYYLYAVGDSLICGDDGCLARTIGPFPDSLIGPYTLLVGLHGALTLYADSTYSLGYERKIFYSSRGLHWSSVDPASDEGWWTATGTMRDTLSFSSDYSSPEFLNLRGVLRGESARRTTTTGATRITPLYMDLHMNDGVVAYKLTFRMPS